MNLKPLHIAWLLVFTLLLHQLEEYFGGFMVWYSETLNADMSPEDFLMINVPFFLVVLLYTLLYSFGAASKMPMVAVATLMVINGVIHGIASLLTFTYSPGVFSGLILYLPLGYVVFRRIYPHLTEAQKVAGIALGVFIHILAPLIALNL